MGKVKNIVYLYSEVMPYAIAVMRALVTEFDAKVDCICWDEHKRTPFVPVDEPGITFHKRSGFDNKSIRIFIEERHPSLIYVVGRMDKLYLKAAVYFKNKYPVVSGCDNQWRGGLKQRTATVLSPLLYKKYFEYLWIPGPRQYEFARKMGYANNKIIPNFLTADADIFGNVHERNKQIKRDKYPHTMVYAGRFAEVKGISILMEAFSDAKKELQNNWTLLLVGSGEMPVSNDPFIEVTGFMSGAELARESINWGGFCLPSTYEPWGVVIHEFAMMGMPVISSDSAGAADTLVINNYNGFVFKSGSKDELKKAILKVMKKSDEELLVMGSRGHELSKMHSPVIAAYSLVSILA